MKENEENDDFGVLLVDANNAFNEINRKHSLHKIKRRWLNHFCITYANFIHAWMKLHVVQKRKNSSRMPIFYAQTWNINITINRRTACACNMDLWCADDSSAFEGLLNVRKWTIDINEKGPKHGHGINLKNGSAVLSGLDAQARKGACGKLQPLCGILRSLWGLLQAPCGPLQPLRGMCRRHVGCCSLCVVCCG